MADVTAVYRAVADFSALKRQADAARRALRQLRAESSDTHADYVAGQEEVTEATDDSTKANTKLTRVLGQVQKQTRDTTKAESSRVDVLTDTIAQIGKQSAAQRENTRLEVEANRAKEKLTLSTAKYQSVAEDAASTDADRAKALDQVRLSSIAAAAATDRLQSSMARLAIGGGGRGGRPRGPGIATDVGGFGRALATAGAGLLATLLLVTPTINVIIAGLIGIVALLGTAVVAAVAFAAAFTAVGVAMGVAAFKFRDLISQSTSGVSEWRAAVVAIEAAAFNAFNRVIAQFRATGEAGTSMWDSIAEGAITLIDKMEPFFVQVGEFFANIIDAAAGVPGAFSPLVEFFKTWIDEWKVLKDIVSEDILPGGPGFFEKYEAPAKAFVEGIAQVINAVRKFSQMGLGLNMDQLAEFIRNVFDVLSELIGIIPRYSNALVKVGLSTSKFAKSLLPLIENIVKVGEVILKDLVAPLIELIEKVLSVLLKLPVVDWLIALGGGFLLAAKGLSVLSFGLLKFNKLISGAYIISIINFGKKIGDVFAILRSGHGIVQALAASGFPKLAVAIRAVGGYLANVGSRLTQLFTGITDISRRASQAIGGFAIATAITLGYVALTVAMDDLHDAEQRVQEGTQEVIDRFARGVITIREAREEIAALAREEAMNAGFWTRVGGAITNFGNTLISGISGGLLGKTSTEDLTERFKAEGIEQFNKNMQALVDNALEGVDATGALTDAQADFLTELKDAPGGAKLYAQFLGEINTAYKDGSLNAGQYAVIMEQLGITVDDTGQKIDLTALKVEGASLIISQALVDIGKDAALATGGIERLGTALGEDTVTFAREATDAFLDLEGGILGTGEKVKQWFLDTSDAIREWKTEVASNFDLVKQAFTDLSGEAKLTWDSFREGIEDAIEASEEMNKNIDIISQWASPKLLTFIAEAGPAAAGLYDILATRGKQGVQFANKALREGADLGVQTAETLGDALGLSMDRVVAAIEVMVSRLLGIPVHEVAKQVEGLVGDVNEATGEVTPLAQRLVPRGERFNVRVPGRQFETGADPRQTRAAERERLAEEQAALDESVMRNTYIRVGKVGIAGGLAAGMAQGTPEVKAASIDLADETIGATKKRFGIASPAREFISIGGAIMEGLAQGFRNGTTLIVTTLQGIRDRIIGVFDEAVTWLGGITVAFRNLSNLLKEELIPAVDDLQTALENLPQSIFIDFDLDTSKAEEAANTFLDNMEKKGLIFQTPTGKQVLHEGGPAGHTGRFATGRPKSGEVDARLQKGEYVFSRKSVQSMGGLGEMDAFHSFLQGKRLFHNGGPVDESEETSAKIRRLAESLGFSGVSATGVLPKQDVQSAVSVSAPGAGRVGVLTAAAANYMATIKKNFPMITGYGTTAVRTIAGTNTWSQHAYSNAVDVMTGSSTALRQAVAFFSNQYRRILSIAHLLADPWFASPRGDHYNHVHADFFPQYGGTPPGQPYRAGGKVRKRGGRVHQNEFVLREGAANALGTGGLDYLNTHADRYGPAAFLEAFNQSFATSATPRMGGVGSGADGADGRAMFSIAMHLDGKTISRSVDVYSREADILLPGR